MPFEGGVGTPKPLSPYYKYFVTMDFGETLDVFRIDLTALRSALNYFKSNNTNVKSIRNVYISPWADNPDDEARNQEDFYYVPDKGLVNLHLEVDDNSPRPLGDKKQFRIPYTALERLKPIEAIGMARERGLVLVAPNGEVDALPCLRRIWDIVEHMDRRLLEGFLDRQIEQLKQQVR